MDIWIACTTSNAPRAIAALRSFGFDVPDLSEAVLLKPDTIIRLGAPPFRIKVLTGVSGVTFEECYAERQRVNIDGVPVSIISLPHLKSNKLASGRGKDLVDLEHLP